MKSCDWCGKENSETTMHCQGCGTPLEPARSEEFNGVREPLAPLRRRRCGGTMAFYSPEARCCTFTRAFKFRYRCSDCDARPLIPSAGQMCRYTLYMLGGGLAIAWLLYSETAQHFDRSREATRSVVFAIVYLVMGISSGYLLAAGYINRLRHPLLREQRSPFAGPSGRRRAGLGNGLPRARP